nr:S-layer homology domain-containing protein [Cloacibacillus sp. An23]
MAFKGAQPATRYEMASIVARALVTVDAEKASKQDMELLKKLVMEFKDELDALGVKVDSLDKRVAVLEDRLGGWKVNGQFWFDARFASGTDDGRNTYGFNNNTDRDENQFGFRFARFMLTKYIDENTFFYGRFRFNDGSGKLDNFFADKFFVQTKLPWDITFTLGRVYSDWEGDAGLYHSVMGDLEGGLWKDQYYDGFNFKKSFGMLDAELLIGRNFDILDGDGDDNNEFMEYGLKLQANFSENFYAGVQGIYFQFDGDENSVTKGDGFYRDYADDYQQYGAYLSYSFTPSIALRGYYYWQDLGDNAAAGEEDSPMAWSAMLDVKQDLLKFTSLWVQYVEQDNAFVGPRAAGQYPALFASDQAGAMGTDGTNKTWLVTAEQQWGESKWSSFLQYVTTDWDQSGVDDTDQYTIGIGYQYTPQIKFWLAYNYIDYGDGNGSENGYTGNESVVLFRTAIDF